MVGTFELATDETTTVEVVGAADEVARVVLAGVVIGQTVVLTAMECVVVCVSLDETMVEHEVAQIVEVVY